MSEDAAPYPERKVETRPGAFGVRHALLVIIRRWSDTRAEDGTREVLVENFILSGGSKKDTISEAYKIKNQVVRDPAFCSFTILEFIEEARMVSASAGPPPPEEGPSKIIIPDAFSRQRFGTN